MESVLSFGVFLASVPLASGLEPPALNQPSVLNGHACDVDDSVGSFLHMTRHDWRVAHTGPLPEIGNMVSPQRGRPIA